MPEIPARKRHSASAKAVVFQRRRRGGWLAGRGRDSNRPFSRFRRRLPKHCSLNSPEIGDLSSSASSFSVGTQDLALDLEILGGHQLEFVETARQNRP